MSPLQLSFDREITYQNHCTEIFHQCVIANRLQMTVDNTSVEPLTFIAKRTVFRKFQKFLQTANINTLDHFFVISTVFVIIIITLLLVLTLYM